MRPARTACLVLAFVLVLPALAPVSSTHPPPERVCGVCGSAFEDAAQYEGVNATVRESELTVRVDADGDSHWQASVTVNEEASERFAANRTLFERIVDRSSDGRTVVDEPRNRSLVLDGRTIRVSFVVEDAVSRSVGDVLLFESFDSGPTGSGIALDADRLVVRGPPGTTVTHAPDGGDVDDNRIVWNRADDEREHGHGTGTDLDALIVFAPDRSRSAVATSVAVRGHALQELVPGLRDYALVPAMLLAFVAAGLVLFGGRLVESPVEKFPIAKWLGACATGYLVLLFVTVLCFEDDLRAPLGCRRRDSATDPTDRRCRHADEQS